MGPVVSLGYAIVDATDLTAWKRFASDLLGLQVSSEDPDRLALRMDSKAYRLNIRRGAEDRVHTLGWEVADANSLAEMTQSLSEAGFSVQVCDQSEVQARMVSGLIRFVDPDGTTVELFYGLKKDKNPFVSPTGAHFITGREGFGHAFQIVSDDEAYRSLYMDVFGFQLSDFIEFGPGKAGTFLHCNQRHHSFAFASIPGEPQAVGHLMFEVDNIDDVGRAYDKVLEGAAPLTRTFGRHSNDEMLSFYAKTPSGFDVEFGFGGLKIEEAEFTPSRYDVASFWGHKPTDPNEPEV